MPITPPIPRFIQDRNIRSRTQTPHTNHGLFLVCGELRATPRYRQGLTIHARVVGEGGPEVGDGGEGPPFLILGGGGPVNEPNLGLGFGCWVCGGLD